MKYDDTKFTDSVKNLEKISSNIDSNNREDLIHALSFYVSQVNHTYHYTETYITDLFFQFDAFLHIFQRKKIFTEKLFEHLLEKKRLSLATVTITVDQLWALKYEKRKWVQEMLPDGNLNKVKGEIIYLSISMANKAKNIVFHQTVQLENEETENWTTFHEKLSSKLNELAIILEN